jgi:endonuclease-3
MRAKTFTEKVRYLGRIRALLRGRYGELPRPQAPNPVEHAIRGILSEEATTAQVDEAMERLRRHFVDWNDLRVSRPREIRECLGKEFPRIGPKARAIPRLLDQVFKRYNSMIWDFLPALGKQEGRTYFESLEDVRPFVAAMIARDFLAAHAFPVDRDIARVLGRLGILDPETQSERQMQAFLERAVKQPVGPELHALLKRLGEDLCILPVPLCPKCPLRSACPSAVIPAKKAKRGAAKGRPKKARTGAARKRGGARPKADRRASRPPPPRA